MKFTPKSYSIKLKAEQSDNLNSFLEENNLEPSTFKEVFQLLLDEVIRPKENLKPEFTEEILKAIEVYKTDQELTHSSNPPEDFIHRALTKSIVEPVPHEIEVIKEVTKDLAENEHIIELSEKQINVLNEIANKRFDYSEKYRKGLQKETPLILLKKLAFDKGTLNNWGGNFYTGRG